MDHPFWTSKEQAVFFCNSVANGDSVLLRAPVFKRTKRSIQASNMNTPKGRSKRLRDKYYDTIDPRGS